MSHIDPPSPKASAGQGPGHVDHHEVEHEHRDVDIRAVVGFAIGMFAVVGVVYVLMYGLLATFQRQAVRDDPALSPLARPAAEMPRTTSDPFFGHAEGVRLITSEPAVLAKHRAMEAEMQSTYGWVDEKSGVARLPIEEAKKLILQRGLPARAEGAADPALGTHRAAYGESSSGRTIQVGRKKEEAPKEEAVPAPAADRKGHGQ